VLQMKVYDSDWLAQGNPDPEARERAAQEPPSHAARKTPGIEFEAASGGGNKALPFLH
jgi:hypothetical protein